MQSPLREALREYRPAIDIYNEEESCCESVCKRWVV